MNNVRMDDGPSLATLTAGIVAAYVSNNALRGDELAALIGTVHAALDSVGRSAPVEAPAKLVPPVSIRKSLGEDFVISLEDGRRYRSLKRHLAGRGLTPQQYRDKWGLPPDYPMVAPSYAKQRSDLAKMMGLGRRPADAPGRPAKTAARRPR